MQSNFLAVLMALCVSVVAQQSSPSQSASAPSSQPQQDQSQAIESGQPQLSKREAKQALTSPDFTPLVTQAILERLTDGLETHNASKTRSVFGPASFDSQFFNRMHAAFDYFESFNVYYHVDSINLENGKGDVTADFRLERVPRDRGLTPRRNITTLHLTLARTTSEWRIVAVDPPNFLFEF